MGAGLAERQSTRLAPGNQLANERYAASLTAIRALGALAILPEISEETFTATAAYEDFATKIIEMLKTDPKLGERVDVNHSRSFSIEDGRVCDTDGTPMVEVVRTGFIASKYAKDERLRTTQALRDEGDVIIAEAVDRLAVGESMIAVSMDPKNELAGRDSAFWQAKGYRPGILYIQWYSRTSEEEVRASAYSADHSNLIVWRTLLRERGVTIPEDIDPNRFIRHSWHFQGDDMEAMRQAKLLRRESYRRAGVSTERVSLDEYLATHDDVLRHTFASYYPQISRSLITGENTAELQDFARTVLGQVRTDSLSPETRQQLLLIANSRRFTDDMARAMDELIPYALAEKFRADLLADWSSWPIKGVRRPATSSWRGTQYLPPELVVTNMIVTNLASGVASGRQYGGCSGTTIVGGADEEHNPGANPGLVPQEIYGGKGTENSKEDPGPDGKGPLRFKCSEGHWNTRKPGELLTECQHKPCKEGSVGCK